MRPEDLQLIGNTVAIRWSDGSEDYLDMEYLRAQSPSAEQKGEPDVTGRTIGGSHQKK
ncbi:MAG: gamma-butyrobetaine hydroxylase-like domain-containing protein, partial [Verrucomicrobiota bacterium]